MSGGHFDYKQYNLYNMRQEIKHLIETNNDKTDNGWGGTIGRFYSDETIAKFRQAMKWLELAEIAVQRIDWLVSDDDGEESFHERWDDEMSKVED